MTTSFQFSTSTRQISRRQFARRAGLAASAVAFAGQAILRAKSPNEKLNIGIIGAGGKGADNLRKVAGENIVALCDIDATSLDKAAQKYSEAKRYRDFRKLLEQKDIDAVVISTPDHVHAVATMMAIKLGKHVYCEKPLTHDLYEARMITQAARQYKVATQMGNAGHSSEGTRQVVEWIQSGVVGAVREVHSWSNRPIWPQGIERPTDTPPVPAHVDWDLWIGPAPMRPYHPAYHPFKWRGWWDFGTGALGDMGCHVLDSPVWALKLGQPVSVEAESPGVNADTFPTWSIVHYQFPARDKQPPVKLTWYDGGKLPSPELTEIPKDQNLFLNGSLFIGEKGKILIEQGRTPRLTPESVMKDFKPPDKFLPRSIGHHEEWIQACKGGKPGGTNFDYAGPLTEIVLHGNLALRVGQKVEWDGPNLKSRNTLQAAQYIRREYREGWGL